MRLSNLKIGVRLYMARHSDGLFCTATTNSQYCIFAVHAAPATVHRKNSPRRAITATIGSHMQTWHV